MTAVETFYASINGALLPAAVPVAEGGLNIGLAALGLSWLGKPDAEGIILSPDPRQRAVAAIFAVRQAKLAVEKRTERV